MRAPRMSVTGMVLVAALLAAACGEAAGSPRAEPASPTTAATAAATPSDTPAAAPTVASPALDGTRWRLVTLRSRDVTGVLITLAFNAGQTGGNAGCNDYGGAYNIAADGAFTLPSVSQTEKACTDPAGVMQLEASYLTALADATLARVTDDRLELADAAGETLLVFASYTRAALGGTSWMLIPREDQPIINDTHITLAFDAGQASGSSGCNQYQLPYTATNDGTLTFGEGTFTLMACADDVMTQEQHYLETLRGVAAYRFNLPSNWLELLDADGNVLLTFANEREPAGADILNNSDWVLTVLDGQALDDGTLITLQLRSSQFGGTTPCTGYTGEMQAAPDGRLPELRRFEGADLCDGDPHAALVLAYFAALDAVTGYRLSGEQLDFVDVNGEVLLSYRPSLADAGGLDGTKWRVLSIAGAAPLAQTEVTLEFGDGNLSGRAGCNYLGARYMAPGPGLLVVTQVLSTAMLCTGPAGVMEQEQAYLHALQESVAFQLTDTQLTLLDAGGAPTLVCERAA